jgi:integrase
MALTKREIDALKPGPKRQPYPDGKVPGLSLVVAPNGTKSFVLQYRPLNSGIPKRITVGRYGTVTLQQARDIALKELAKVRNGEDPAEERKQARVRDKTEITWKDYEPIYVEQARDHGTPRKRREMKPKKTWAEDKRRLDKYVVPAWGRRRLADITEQDVRRLHRSIPRKFEANRVVALVSVAYTTAAYLGHVAKGFNPAVDVPLNDEGHGRTRVASTAELKTLCAAIHGDAEPLRSMWLLYLLTGFRRGELLGLTWSDIDWERRVLRVEQTKQGKPHILPATDTVLALLKEQTRMVGNTHVFGSPVIPGAAWHPHAVKRAWSRLRKRAGMPELRLHDIRRTVAASMADAGESELVIAAVLGHTAQSVTAKHYAHVQLDPVRAALERHTGRVMAVYNAQLPDVADGSGAS